MIELLKSLQDTLTSRVKSLLLMNFIFSWIIINYDISLKLLFDSKMDINQNIQFIKNTPFDLWFMLGLPIIVTLFYIYAIPFANFWLNKWYESLIINKEDELKHNKQINALKRAKAKNKIILHDKNYLNKELENDQKTIENRLEAERLENEEKVKSRKKIMEEIEEIEKLNNQLKENYTLLENDHNNLKENFTNLESDHDNLKENFTNLESDHDNLKEIFVNVEDEYQELQNMYNNLQNKENKIIIKKQTDENLSKLKDRPNLINFDDHLSERQEENELKKEMLHKSKKNGPSSSMQDTKSPLSKAALATANFLGTQPQLSKAALASANFLGTQPQLSKAALASANFLGTQPQLSKALEKKTFDQSGHNEP